jgi:hypothetical protein
VVHVRIIQPLHSLHIAEYHLRLQLCDAAGEGQGVGNSKWQRGTNARQGKGTAGMVQRLIVLLCGVHRSRLALAVHQQHVKTRRSALLDMQAYHPNH